LHLPPPHRAGDPSVALATVAELCRRHRPA